MNHSSRAFRLHRRILLGLFLVQTLSVASEPHWSGAWYSPPQAALPLFANATAHTVVHLTTGGDRLRLRFSNLYGHSALKIGAVYVSTQAGGKDVTFKGEEQVTLGPGIGAMSDPVNLATQPGAELVVSVFYPEPIPREITQQAGTSEGDRLTPGNTVHHAALTSTAKPLDATYFLTGIDVEGAASGGSIVVIADSMTGGGSKKWPALLAQRLSKAGKSYGVLNAAIGGNRILRDSQVAYGGPSVLNRFERDVLDQPGVKYVIMYEGINDIGVDGLDGLGTPRPASAAELAAGVRRLAARAHEHGIKFYATTQAPFGDRPSDYVSPEKERVRQAYNEWIRTSRDFDGYVDFERALADPARPDHLKPEFDLYSHPNDAGQRALSERYRSRIV